MKPLLAKDPFEGLEPIPLTKPTPWYKATGMGFMRGATDIAGAVTLAAGGLGHALGMEEEGDNLFKFYEDVITEAKKYWTPDPESVGAAGKFLGGIAGIGVPLMLGPGAAPAMIASSTFGTGADLVEAGVDAKTATAAGIFGGAATAAMIALPASGRTLKETLALIGLNPVLGAATEAGQKKLVETAGYKEQAQFFDPFNPTNRAIDLIMGGFFGYMGYKNLRRALPQHLEDALDTASLAQKAGKNNPFEGARNVSRHIEATDKAVNDLVAGRPVDVSETLKGVRPEDIKQDMPLEPETAKIREEANKAMSDVEATVSPAELSDVRQVFDRMVGGKKVEGVTKGVKGETITEVAEKGEAARAKTYLDNDPVEAEGERILAEKGDMNMHVGTDETGEAVTKTAREVVDEAKADVEKAEKASDLFDMAADCLRKG